MRGRMRGGMLDVGAGCGWKDAGLSGAAPDCPLPLLTPPPTAGLGSGGGHADAEGMAGEGLSPLDYALHPPFPAPPCLAIPCGGGLQNGAVGRERRRPAPPPHPLPAPGEALHSLLLWGVPGTHQALPTPPHHWLPPPSCSPPLSPTTRGASLPHSPQSPGLQCLCPVHRPYKVPPVPHDPAPLPAMPPAPWLQHTGQVAAVIQAWQHAVALPPAWHKHDRAAAA